VSFIIWRVSDTRWNRDINEKSGKEEITEKSLSRKAGGFFYFKIKLGMEIAIIISRREYNGEYRDPPLGPEPENRL
jgi:hypothetical protein